MTKIKIITSFSRYSDADLEQKAELIVDSMTGNVNFANPVPSLAKLQAATTAFDTAIIKAKEGGKTEQLARNLKREELTGLLEKLALYVQIEADGNDAVLASSGFSLSKIRNVVGTLPKPQNFALHVENVGKIKLSLKPVRGAKSYLYEYRKKGEEVWDIMVYTKTTLVLTELESGQMYEFRVAPVGSSTEKTYSDVLSSYIL
ncbi:hypothetical protein CLV94_1644 [Flavobacterium endophyticum]|uniref:Fibronectin type-III domain-containing protein n=1 Tax=Flavobacterium endophyticum TaxID=1540163 RepID=A0A495MKV1_9FLAO|nr:fibronectin type III domain-containing protein [Flavobacterium endophyticum]RKS26581.1 hypothetical protein CLV94_1644 [Flavobacterium endophyticum]